MDFKKLCRIIDSTITIHPSSIDSIVDEVLDCWQESSQDNLVVDVDCSALNLSKEELEELEVVISEGVSSELSDIGETVDCAVELCDLTLKVTIGIK